MPKGKNSKVDLFRNLVFKYSTSIIPQRIMEQKKLVVSKTIFNKFKEFDDKNDDNYCEYLDIEKE